MQGDHWKTRRSGFRSGDNGEPASAVACRKASTEFSRRFVLATGVRAGGTADVKAS